MSGMLSEAATKRTAEGRTMTDGPLVRNSRLLGLFVEIIQGPEGTLRAVETVGRGVAGEARCTLNVVADKMTTSSDSPAEARRRSLACGAYRGRVASLCRLIDAVDFGIVGGPIRA
ncbi:hypothetical protein ACN26Y_06265 [Micromonospora sp. WMMD558]|uniref:hypothetical protein n=1 Tax=unclassified Micromonospora TaxID=2617518 RepID=UPI0012B44D15|nr:hypothetical protein [Micromonospora sp. WMMC415]QGN45933.1 hypothetical protein GKC29_03060 [Micromonospora sp. WMMC415]